MYFFRKLRDVLKGHFIFIEKYFPGGIKVYEKIPSIELNLYSPAAFLFTASW
jgi:hypothetical protein